MVGDAFWAKQLCVRSPQPKGCFYLQVNGHRMGMQTDARKGLTGTDPKESRKIVKHLSLDEKPVIK